MELNFDKLNGLVPAVVQDVKSGEVLMLAFLNKEAWEKTLQTGKAHFYSRTKKRVWMKGETSGHIQKIEKILIDCDDDSVILQVDQNGGAACHTGYNSCFFRELKGDKDIKLIKKDKVFNPQEVYSKHGKA